MQGNEPDFRVIGRGTEAKAAVEPVLIVSEDGVTAAHVHHGR